MEVSKSFVPYLNISAKSRSSSFDDAPDQGLLREKGGRGFPYCAILDENGEVLWEARPTSKEVVLEALANASRLNELKGRLAENPDDAGLAASVKLFASFGMGQREAPPLDELKSLAETEGLDAKVLELWKAELVDREFEAYLESLQKEAGSRKDAGIAAYKAWVGGKRPPKGSKSMAGVQYTFMALNGAIDEKNRAHSEQLLADLEKGLKDAGQPPEVFERVATGLRKRIGELE